MARPRTPIGTCGTITCRTMPNGAVVARTRHRDEDGRSRQVEASGRTATEAGRNLKLKLSRRVGQYMGAGEITADTPFPRLVDLWLEDLELEDRLAQGTRDLYNWNITHLVLPVFEHFTLREMSVSRCDRFLKAQAKISYSRAKQAKTVLSLAMGLAVRYDAIPRNPVRDVARLKRSQSEVMALTKTQVRAIRDAVRTWRTGEGLCGPKPDGQLGQIIEIMLGSSARIGEVLAVRKCDVIMPDGDEAGTQRLQVRICGTIVSPKGKPTHRQDKPKTDSSRRVVTLPSYAAEAVLQRLALLADEDDEHLLFFSRNHTPLTTNNVRRQLRAVLKLAGISGVTPHAFRRTVATSVNRAEDAELAADLLGHSSSKITKTHYIEKDEIVDPRTADILEAEFAPAA